MAQEPLSESQQSELETLIDRHGIAAVLDAIGEICALKATHVNDNWQDGRLARDWTHIGKVLAKTADFSAAL